MEEARCQASECEAYNLYRTIITEADPRVDPRPFIYTLHVPGLREMSLRIEVGDVVQIRQVSFNHRGDVIFGPSFSTPGGVPIILPQPQVIQHDCVVWSIDRRSEILSLRIDHLQPHSMLFNVKFTTQLSRFHAMDNAMFSAQNALVQDEGWLSSILFPRKSDGYYQKELNRLQHGLELHDAELNYEQTRAISIVINELYGPVPLIISGPPGTGKTKTTVEIMLQLLKKDRAAHILMCAPSDSAADTLIERLRAHLLPGQLLRINAPSRSFPGVPMTVLPFCFVDNGMFSQPPFAELMRKKIVVTTCRDADILVRARVTNADLSRFEREMHMALNPEDTLDAPKRLHWTGLLIDEAAQATEPEALIPMIVVAPSDDHGISDKDLPPLVLAGDQHQLGPRTASKASEISISLFERLSKRRFYSRHPLVRSKQSGGIMRPITSDLLPILRPAFANLIRNYRSHPAILATPSTLFYDDTLEPEAPGTDALASWPGWQGRGWPVLFACNSSPDEVERDGGGWYNVKEASMACRYAASLLQTGLVEAKDICIMSPFRAQVKLLRNFARAGTGTAFLAPTSPPALGEVNIGPLEAFQGLEKRVVILCTTRTRDRFLDQDLAKGLGVMHEPKRFNVALTRAMHGLVVIGNPDLLEKDENWRHFLGFCWRNGLWEEEDVKGKGKGKGQVWVPKGEQGRMSRLERQMVRSDEAAEKTSEELSRGVRALGRGWDAEEEVWRSGVEAEREVGAEVVEE